MNPYYNAIFGSKILFGVSLGEPSVSWPVRNEKIFIDSFTNQSDKLCAGKKSVSHRVTGL